MEKTDRLHINMSITFSARTQPHGPTTPVGGQLRAHSYVHSVSIVAGVFTALLDNLFSLHYKGNAPTTTDAVLVKSRQNSAFATKQTEPLTSREDVDPSKLSDQGEETPKYLYQLVDLTKRIVAVHENVKVYRHREQKYVVIQASKQ
ncbi:unnamed protein product [Dibothriocephalus latus]|uniref:Uncharacterized protein n=1 Tax=Dibothriocephalus latus TaxID=60516 RepID=A0A3P6S4C1_DIBLA|nr:unnamed protein product [Dibothriocephalus latus]